MFSLLNAKNAITALTIGVLGFSSISNTAHAGGDWYNSDGAYVGYGLVAGLIIGSHLSNRHSRSHVDYSYSYHSGYRHRGHSSFSYSYSTAPRYYHSYSRHYYNNDYCPPRYYRSYHRPVHHTSVTYVQPVQYVEPEPVYQPVESGIQPGSYIKYREKSAFPFYHKKELEVIPPLPPVQPGRSQAVNNASFANQLRGSYAAPQTQQYQGAQEYQQPAAGTQSAPATQQVPAAAVMPHPSEYREVMTVSNRAGSHLNQSYEEPQTAGKPSAYTSPVEMVSMPNSQRDPVPVSTTRRNGILTRTSKLDTAQTALVDAPNY